MVQNDFKKRQKESSRLAIRLAKAEIKRLERLLKKQKSVFKNETKRLKLLN